MIAVGLPASLRRSASTLGIYRHGSGASAISPRGDGGGTRRGCKVCQRLCARESRRRAHAGRHAAPGASCFDMRSIPPAPVIVYRAMGTDGAGKILTGARYAELGVRPGVDIKVDAAGLVQPGDRGMSVVPDSPVHLFPGVRPRALPGGRGSLPIFWLDSSELPSGRAAWSSSPRRSPPLRFTR